MPRKVSKEANVAYFDNPDQVTEPGFYIVEDDQLPRLGKKVVADPDAEEGWVYAESAQDE